MFGHQDDKKHDDEKPSGPEVASILDTTANPAGNDAPAGHENAGDTVAPTPAAPSTDDAPADKPEDKDDKPAEDAAPAADSAAAPSDDNAWQHPGAPLGDDKDEDEDDEESEDEAPESPEPIKDIIGTNAGPDFKPFPHPAAGGPVDDASPHELIDIKQKALTELEPLVGQLDQNPEDKFRTLMMIIQASDDQSLIQSAYAAANEIKDEKVRAQALLDLVNEINYFTQHPEN
jgi:hypothetical protein